MLRLRFTLTLLGVLGLVVGVPGTTSRMARAGPADCPVTPYAAEGVDDSFTTTWFGDNDFWAGLDLGHGGRWYAGPEFMKVQWRLPSAVRLSVTGKRLDSSAPPLEVEIPPGYERGFQPSALTFPTAGAW